MTTNWFGWFLPCAWIRLVIRKIFQKLIWGWWWRGIRRNFNIILHNTNTFLFPHCIIMTQCVFKFFLCLVLISITSEACKLFFSQGKMENQSYVWIFSYHPLLKTHSNQKHDNAVRQPPFPESIQQIIEKIIHSVPVWRLYNW